MQGKQLHQVQRELQEQQLAMQKSFHDNQQQIRAQKVRPTFYH